MADSAITHKACAEPALRAVPLRSTACYGDTPAVSDCGLIAGQACSDGCLRRADLLLPVGGAVKAAAASNGGDSARRIRMMYEPMLVCPSVCQGMFARRRVELGV